MSVEPKARRSGRETRALIEREALRLFALKGVDGASIRDIALAVGVADAALYRHFPSKDEIAQSLFAKHYGELASRIETIGTDQTAFPKIIEQLVALFCELFDGRPDVFRFILINQHAHLGAIRDEENAVAQLVAIMGRASLSGDISVTDENLAAAIALGAVIQPAVFQLYGRITGPLRPHAPRIAASVLAALGAAPL